MKTHAARLQKASPLVFMLLMALATRSAPAGVHYVNVNNSAPNPPYSTWEMAATNIQDAVDVAVAGDEIAVTNGIYQAGERTWPAAGSETNRLAVTKPLSIYSVNGAGVTIIDGGANVRCVYLTADTTLTGFTLTNGFATKGGALYCESNSATIIDCVLTGNRAGNYGGGVGGAAYGGTLIKCALISNRAPFGGSGGGAAYATLNDCLLATNYASYVGGGALQCTLNDCVLMSNDAVDGGGALQSILNNCSLENNYSWDGGGANHCTLNNCSLKNNWADNWGGGASWSTLNNCDITGNYAELAGGGARFSTLNNCKISENWAWDGGGGTASCTVNNCLLLDNITTGQPGFSGFGGGDTWSTLNNCTLTGNVAGYGGGGAFEATLNNCIVYYNTAPEDLNFDSDCTLNYCCTTPIPANGNHNIVSPPLFIDLGQENLRLQLNSPCINAGNNADVTSSNDLDGNPRISGGTVDLGAYEFVLAKRLFSSRLSDTDYCFSFETESDRTYIIEYKNALSDPAWNSCPPIIGNGQVFTITNCIFDAPQRFYRLRAD